MDFVSLFGQSDVHRFEPPAPNAASAIAATEQRLGHRLPDDLRQFYTQCGSASLFEGEIRLLALDEIDRVSVLQLHDASEEVLPATWIALFDMLNGDYVGIDLASVSGTHAKILDYPHEDTGNAFVVALSFTEFLGGLLAFVDILDWLEREAPDYGTASYVPPDFEPPPGFFDTADWVKALGEETGPAGCKKEDCERRRIDYSVYCRQHHYEAVRGLKPPIRW